MIRLFIGTPGAGKSYAALKDVVEELVYGNRLIITNLPILAGELNAWLAVNHSTWTDDINLRLRIINEDETKQFYKFRAITGAIGQVTPEDSREGRHLPYGDHRGNGILYVIDEAHIPFDSREWASTGPELTYYNSQHRKLWDELIFITQFEKLIDVRVRGFVQEFCYFNNNGMERFWTYFQKPQSFTMEVHRKPPSGPSAPKPLETHHYRMDFTLAKCYDTSAGVGISGRRKPETRRKKSLSIWWLVAAAIVGGIALTQVPGWMGKGAGFLVRGGKTAQQKAQEAVKEVTGGVPPVEPTIQKKPQQPEGKPPEVLYATGYAAGPKGVIVQLSDGTRRVTVPGVAERVLIRGRSYELKQKPAQPENLERVKRALKTERSKKGDDDGTQQSSTGGTKKDEKTLDDDG